MAYKCISTKLSSLSLKVGENFSSKREAKIDWPVIDRFLNNITPAVTNIRDQSSRIKEPSDIGRKIKDIAHSVLKNIDEIKRLKFPL